MLIMEDQRDAENAVVELKKQLSTTTETRLRLLEELRPSTLPVLAKLYFGFNHAVPSYGL